jgi:hypothetical protein
VFEAKQGCVEEVSLERRQQYCTHAFLARRAINGIARHLQTQRGKMNSNLVGASRAQIGLDQRKGPDAPEQPPIGLGVAAFPAPRRHSRTSAQVASYGKFDASSIAFYQAVQKSDVFFCDAAILKFGGKYAVRFVIARDHHRSRSALIETVNDPRTHRPANRGKPSGPAEAMKKHGDKGAANGPSSRVNYHSGGLIDHGYVAIFIENFERQIFGGNGGWGTRLDFNNDGFASLHLVGRLLDSAIDSNMAAFDQGLNPRPAKIGNFGGEEAIKALARAFSIHY